MKFGELFTKRGFEGHGHGLGGFNGFSEFNRFGLYELYKLLFGLRAIQIHWIHVLKIYLYIKQIQRIMLEFTKVLLVAF